MMQDLRAVTDWYPELADAYNMLGMARIEGGGINSALEAQRQAIALAPRNIEYQFNLGQIYVAGKKWEQARELFTRIKAGPDRAAAAAAKQQLEDLDTLQKYGVRPQRAGESEAPAGAASTPAAATGARANAALAKESSSNDDEDADVAPKPAAPKPGTTGPVQFLKGKIVSSDCSKPPEATVTVLSGMTTYKMHAADFKSLLVIGEDQFSCEWKNRLVSVNYRAIGKQAGEFVSVELALKAPPQQNMRRWSPEISGWRIHSSSNEFITLNFVSAMPARQPISIARDSAFLRLPIAGSRPGSASEPPTR